VEILMADAATVVMFDVFNSAFKYAVVLRGGDDYEVVVAGGESSDEHKRLFESRMKHVMETNDGNPTFEQIASVLFYNMSMIGDMKTFSDAGEALRFAQEIASESPTADDYGKRQ
jgi:hypothetical protein